MPNATAARRLSSLLPAWWQLLQEWATNGQLQQAASQAQRLEQPPEPLSQLTARLAAGDTSDLPQLELLDTAAMGDALGAYATTTGSIDLNGDWLQTADERAVQAVLTEELGHHLDALLNPADTPGDEGAVFAELLMRNGLSPELRDRLATENNWGVVRVDGTAVAVEQANITGTAGDDVLPGTAAADSILGLEGNDQLYGGEGNDKLNGGSGDDYFIVESGSDQIDGGLGSDIYRFDYRDRTAGMVMVYDPTTGNGSITVGSEGDTLVSIDKFFYSAGGITG